MDPAVLNALIVDYLSKKDKVLAQTLKAKLKAVSCREIKRKMKKRLKHIFFHRKRILLSGPKSSMSDFFKHVVFTFPT